MLRWRGLSRFSKPAARRPGLKLPVENRKTECIELALGDNTDRISFFINRNGKHNVQFRVSIIITVIYTNRETFTKTSWVCELKAIRITESVLLAQAPNPFSRFHQVFNNLKKGAL